MKSNKIMCIESLVFNLPDDFDGTITDALELVVEYRRSNDAISNRKIEDAIIVCDDHKEDISNTAIEKLWFSPNTKLHLNASLSFFEGDRWENKNEDERMKQNGIIK